MSEEKKVDPVSVRFRPSVEAAVEALADRKGISRNKAIEMLVELGLDFQSLVEKRFGIHYQGLSQN